MSSPDNTVTEVTENYYDSPDADMFYRTIWGGEDIHIGLYNGPEDSIRDASRRTVEHMAAKLVGLGPDKRVLDLGSGYGGAARYLAASFGCHVTCLNLSEVENERNAALTAEQGLQERIEIVHGSFEDVPAGAGDFDIAWSQDAILHSGNRAQVLEEVARVLKPGGQFIFTDPMQADDLEDLSVLKPIYDRIHLESLGSIGFYSRELTRLGFRQVDIEILTDQLRTHYDRVGSALEASYGDITRSLSKDYADRMLAGLRRWVEGADQGYLVWGILQFAKP